MIRFFARARIARRVALRSAKRLTFERLEERCLLTTFSVTNKDESGTGSLRQAIEDANDSAGADKVLVAENLSGKTIKIDSSLPQITESLKILNKNDKNVVVDGQDIAGVRPFNIAAGAIVTLKKLTVTGGNVDGIVDGSDSGGAIVNLGGTLKVTSCIVTGNQTSAAGNSAGGIANLSSGALTVMNSTISNNRAVNAGGGIYNAAELSIISSRLTANSCGESGGALANIGATASATITDSSMNANVAGSNGGGFVNADPALLRVERSTISGNRAFHNGGGGFVFQGNAIFLNTTIAHNISMTLVGGGLAVSGAATLENCTVTGNADTSLQVEGAGGIARVGGSLVVRNTIISGNSAVPGAADNNVQLSDLNENTANFIGGDARLGPLENNGGPTQTMAPHDGSPVIDAGSNAAATGADLTTDQRGEGFDRIVGGTVDIGAFETQAGEPLPQRAPHERRSRDGERDSFSAGTFDIDLAFAAAVLNQYRGAKSEAASRFEAFAENESIAY